MGDKDSWDNWFSHLERDGDDCFDFNQCQTNSSVKVDEFGRDIQRQLAFSSENEIHSSYPSSAIQSNSAATVISAVSCLSFDGQSPGSSNAVAGILPEQESTGLKSSGPKRIPENRNTEPRSSRGTKKARSFSEAQDHIMSERKRRQEMAERFIALSAIIPGLKKIDKASVLREAINYVKQLQERIEVLEKEKSEKNTGTNSVIQVTKSHLCSMSCKSKTSSNDYCGSNEVLPHVEAIGLEKQVLIKILCENRKGIMLKLLALLGNIHLSIASTSMLPFGNSTLSITMIAQKDEGCNMTVNDLVKHLRRDLLKL